MAARRLFWVFRGFCEVVGVESFGFGVWAAGLAIQSSTWKVAEPEFLYPVPGTSNLETVHVDFRPRPPYTPISTETPKPQL